MTAPMTMTPPGSIIPVRLGRLLLVACWLTVGYGTAEATLHQSSLLGLAAWLSTLVFLLTFTLTVERGSWVALLPVSGAATVVMQLLAPSNGAFVAVIAVIAVAGIRLDTTPSRRLSVLCGGGFLAASVLGNRPFTPVEIASVVPGLLFTYLGATATRRLRAEQRRSEELLQEALAGRDARVRAAALDERARLAREMHDVLAHTLSALSIQLEGTRLLAEERSSDPSVVAAVERAGRLAKEGLGEARRAVGSLRDETLPGPDLLPQLLKEFEEDTGVPCRLQIDGRAYTLSAEARLALYRIAQEALTNVRKHADASSVEMALSYRPDGVVLTVENAGTPRATPLPGGGYGMSGMRERAALLGGRLEAGPTSTGFRVCLWLPTRADSPSAS